jgi:hypothetical protein
MTGGAPGDARADPSGFDDCHVDAGVSQVHGRGESGDAGPHDADVHAPISGE